MKVLTVNFSDSEGGAARAAHRLHNGLIKIGVESLMMVLSKNKTDMTIIGPETAGQKKWAKLKSILNTIPLKKYKLTGTYSPSFVSGQDLVNRINLQKPDIVHLHWIHAGMLRIEDLPKIKAPIVWSMHDMWLFTGGCHYAGECLSYNDSCGKCPILSSDSYNDISKKLFLRKLKTIKQIQNLTTIGLSQWLRETAKSSKLLHDFKVINLPNPIDTNIFSPCDKKRARETFGLPKDKKLVLFGAMSSTSDPRKGFEELKLALKSLKTKNVELIVFGNSGAMKSDELGFQMNLLGTIDDDNDLKLLYNAADVMVVPSLEENLSNAIMESLSCGIPVVGFDIGGNKDMIHHKTNGYLAKEKDHLDLAIGIDYVLSNSDYDKMSQQARQTVLNNFESDKVSKKYLELYKHILRNG